MEEQKVLEVVRGLARELNPDHEIEVGLNTHLEWDLGLGSIERHELLIRLERALGRSLASQEVFQATRVVDLTRVHTSEQQDQSIVYDVTGEGGQASPEELKNLVEVLRFQSQANADRKALYFLEDGQEVEAWSYAQLWEAAGRLAGSLKKLGVSPEERVGIMLPTGSDYLALFFGILWLGAIPVPLYPPFRLDQLEDYVKRQSAILRVAGVRCLVSFDRARAVLPLLQVECPQLDQVVSVSELEGEPPQTDPRERALIQFTSGSTGLPKGVVLTHENLLANIRAYGIALEVNPEDVCVSWLPLYHDMGLIGSMLGSIYHGTPLVLMGPQDFLARPSRWLRALHQYRGTISPAPNFAYEICARKIPDEELKDLDLSPWRVALNGAEAVRPRTLERFTERYEPFGFTDGAHFPAYGLAEASLAVTFPPPGRGPVIDMISREALEAKGLAASCGPGETSLELVSCGRPLPGMEVRIVDQDRHLQPDRVRGSVEFRGPSSLNCYFENPEATQAVKDAQGWVRTGDLGYLSEGELYLTGRVKDVIIKAGRNIQAEDVEDIVAGVQGVRRGCVAAFGVVSERDGTERMVIVAETRSTPVVELSNAIEQEVSRRLGLPPDEVVVVPPHTVPKTPSGKIRRSECKERYQKDQLRRRGGRAGLAARLLLGAFKSGLKRGAEKARSSWCYSWLLATLSVPQFVALGSPKRARRLLGPMARFYLRRCGVRLVVEGEVARGPCILVCNHASTLDPLVVTAAWPTPVRFMVAQWVAAHPMFSYLIRRLGHLPVHRGEAQLVAEQELKLRKVLEAGNILGVFPEGGIEVTPGLRPFALGAFKLAAEAGVPIVPVALQGTRKAQPWPRMVPFGTSISATLGPPMYARGEEFADVLALRNRCRSWIAERCGDPISHRRLRRND